MLFFLLFGMLTRANKLELGMGFLKWVIYVGGQNGFSANQEDWALLQQKSSQLKKTCMKLVKKLENQNPKLACKQGQHTKGIFTDFLFQEIATIDDHSLSKALRVADSLEVNDPQVSKELVWGYLQNQSIQNQNLSRQHSTSDHLARLMIKLIEKQAFQTVCDLGSGWGILGGQLLQKFDGIRFYGQEILLHAYFLSVIHFLMLGHTDVCLEYGDLIQHPRHRESSELKRFDVVLGDLPITNQAYDHDTLEDRERFPVSITKGTSTDWLFVLHAIHVLKPNGTAVIVMPTASLNKTGDQPVRKFLIEKDYIDSIIDLPESISETASQPRSLVVLKKIKEPAQKERILMIDAFSQSAFGSEIGAGDWISSIVDIYSKGKSMQAISTWCNHEEIIQNAFCIGASRYVQGKDHYVEGAPIQPLKNATLRVFRGLQIRPENYEPRARYENQPFAFFLNSGDITDPYDPQPYQPREIHVVNEKWFTYSLQEGDIILSARGTTIRTMIINSRHIPAIASANVICIRLNTKIADPYFFKAFFDSPRGQMLLHTIQTGRKIKVINTGNLESLLVPLPSLEQQHTIGSVFKSAYDHYDKARDYFQTALNQVFQVFER